jgi:ATP-dependent helicase/nuclease subunit A
MRNWTDEQNRAVNHPAAAKSALVSAAAGSGKTAVLVERVVRLLVDGSVRADRIVLVTFTKKAAAEMKERLEKALKSLTETAVIRKQLIRLEQAQITTINAFCLNLLRENSGFLRSESGAVLEPGFKVADTEELELLAKKAMQETLEIFYEGDLIEIEQTIAFFGGSGKSGDFNLQRAIRELYDFTRNLPNSEEWLARQIELYGDSDGYYEKAVPQYWGLVEKDIKRAVELTQKSLEIAEFDKTKKFLEADSAFFKSGGDFPRMSIHKDEDDEVKEQIKENRKKVKKIKEDVEVSRVLVDDFKNAVERLCPIVRVLARLYEVYERMFTKVKRVNGVIDFPDSERLCLELLRNEQILERICGNYELIIVDEFQDSNFLQYELFRLLDNGRNRLFAVGDIKQSIYGFRGADSAVFDMVSGDSGYEQLEMSMNFRSSKQVIDGVNAVFPNSLRAKPDAADDDGYITELVLLNEDIEAEYTARRIKKMVSEGAEYKDFAVLTSAGEKNFKAYEKVFAEHGIPCASSGGGGYLKSEEIGPALDFLRVINNPYNDLSLFNVMMSPLFGFSAEEMAQIRAGKRDIPLYSAVLRDKSKNKSEKTAAFLQIVGKYRRIADVASSAELVAVIHADKIFEPLISDRYKRANLQLLSYYAGKFSQSNTDTGLAAFLAWFKDLIGLGVDVKQANVNARSRECVKLMTIHGAKGLEFPVVFVGRVNTRFNFRGEGTGLVRFHKVAGIAADWFDFNLDSLCRFKTMLTDWENRLNREFTVAEERRKLYVAATRAQKKLIFTGYGEKIKENSYAEWLVQAGLSESGMIDDVGAACENNDNEQGAQKAEEFGEYARKPLASIPRKLTATQVGVVHDISKHEHDEPTIFPRNPSFFGEKKLTGKKRGDAYHKVMAGEKLTEFERKAVNFADIDRFWESSLGKRVTASNKVEREYKLYTEITPLDVEGSFPDKQFVQGVADMFFYEDDGIVLVDYKTNRNTTAEKLIHDYRGQLLIYKRAIEEMTGDIVKECYLYSFEIGEIRCDI